MKKLLVFLCASLLVFSIAREASCDYFYATRVATYQVSSYLVQINSVTGEVTDIGNAPIQGAISDLAYSPDGTLYAYDSSDVNNNGYDRIVTIDTLTGIATVVTDVIGWSGGGVGIAFGPDGTLYASDIGDLVTINITTGAATLVGTNPGEEYDVDGLAFSSDGTLYGINGAGPGSIFSLYTFDLTNGINTPGTPYLPSDPYPPSDPDGRNIQSLAFDPDGILIGLDNGDGRFGGFGDEFLVTIDLNTGETTEIGQISNGFYGGLIYGGPDPINPNPHPSKAMPWIPLLLHDN